MKSSIPKAVGLAIFLSIVTTTVTCPVSAAANDDIWCLDSSTSAARIFFGSAKNPNSVNVGVGRVTGKINLDAHNLDQSVVQLNIYPAGEDWIKSLSADGDLAAGYVPDATDNILLTFKSRRIVARVDGTLKITGDLTLTQVERSVTVDPNEGYSGPVYGNPVMHISTEEITLSFPNIKALESRAPGTETRAGKRTVQVLATTHIAHETFPEVSNAITETNWPPVVANERCQAPSVGEDFDGVVCTGVIIATVQADNCHEPLSIGEDYSGVICDSPAGDQTTIVLQLSLTNTTAR